MFNQDFKFTCVKLVTFLPGTLSECQTVLSKIRANTLLVLTWALTVCKVYQQRPYLSFLHFLFFEETQILNSYKYFTGLSSQAEKILLSLEWAILNRIKGTLKKQACISRRNKINNMDTGQGPVYQWLTFTFAPFSIRHSITSVWP